MSGKYIAFTSACLILLVGVVYFLFRESSVSGKVYWEGQPVAAGQITFESADIQLTTQINDGQYEIRNANLSGKFKVRVDVHFVDPSEATEFYANLTKELNPDKGFDPQIDSEPGSQFEDEVVAKQAKSGENEISSLRQFEFDEELGGGWNSRDYFLPPGSD